jgi:hypothetical protein
LRVARAGVGKAGSDVVRAAQSASAAYKQTANVTRGPANGGAPAPRFTPQVGALAAGVAAREEAPDLVTASVNLTRAEHAYKATAAAFKATAETTETLLDTLI